MQIATHTVVSMYYKVATSEGEHVDASQPGEPLVFIVGEEQIVPGLERALIGKQKGDSVEVVTPKGSKVYEVVKVKFG